ncbi:NFACT family protein [Methanospirillum sp. J.3.6.1-F.2.7.3]|uniref:NFACT family protein n=1 Tax=Methanospirillum purgamenti TaxID=2834276 RepID=A0A8E7EJ16_9EURY|nr:MULTISPECIES: ribosome rescue protein RqcH [Methanospirillum]MDX8550430.1 ribosome rescue protein RqcH [Methanospirillum hungatei]QVV88126.1 NFACT family protein [Methanospirillum sp. J.3.6.1-F.2.7.3]
MATAQGMSGLDLITVTDEISRLLPLWVHKVYLDEKRLCVIRLNSKEQGKFNLLIEPGRRLHMIPTLPEMPQIPPAFAMLLRKYLAGGRITDIRQQGLQRTIIIDVRKSEQLFHIIIEVFDEGNIILCNEDLSIIQPLTRQRFKDRDVLPGAVYVFQPPDVSSLSKEEFAERLAGDDRDIVRSLAVGSFLGGRYAEYIVSTTGVDKNILAKDVDASVVYNAIHTLLDTVRTHPRPVLSKSGCHPIPFGNEEEGSFDSFNTALAAFYPLAPPVKKQEEKKRVSREDRIRHQQEEAIEKFKKNITRNEELAALIYEHYGFVSEIITTLSKASESRSWQDIEEILKKDTTGSGKKIIRVFPADAAVELDLSRPVKIFVHESIDQNAGRYYDQVKKFKKKLTGARAAMEREVQQVRTRKVQYQRPKKRWFDRFRWFYTSDQVLVIGGRDAGQNEELIRKYLEGGDTFVHADVHGASVVVVKGKTDVMEEVAQFAAVYSGAWRAGFASADVYAARPDQVSKTAESGEYLSRGSFVVRGERQWYRDVPLEVVIGLQKTPLTRIIGGPASSITRICDLYVALRPGTFEPNDIAKKVVRSLRDRLSADDQKALKFALNTEAVAGFVPPGGSDLVEG